MTWANDHMEAWVNPDGALLIKTRIDKPIDGHEVFYIVDTLEKVCNEPESGYAAAASGGPED